VSILDKYPNGGDINADDWNQLMEEIASENEKLREIQSKKSFSEREEEDIYDIKLFKKLVNDGKMKIKWKEKT